MKQLRVGVIGYGLRGDLAHNWHKPKGNTIITALAEIDDEAIERFKKDVTEDCFFTNDYREMLTRDDVDAVIILTEDYKHFEHTKDALQAGKHVYLEKPIAITIEDSDEIIALAQETGKKLMIGHNMRYMPMYQTMKKYIDEGFIGEVKAIWVRHFVGFGGYFYYQDWHRNSKYVNSLLLQKAAHDIDVIHMLGGSYTKKVSAFGSLDFYDDEENFKADGLTHQTDAEIDVEDNSVLIMELENGIKASYLQCHFTPDYSRNYVVIGTKGRMENDDVNDTITIKTRSTGSLEDKSDLIIQMKKFDGAHAGADPLIAEAFVDYIFDGKEPNASPEDARMSVAVGVKATESLREGGGVKLIPPIE